MLLIADDYATRVDFAADAAFVRPITLPPP